MEENKGTVRPVSVSPANFRAVEVVTGPARLESLRHLFGDHQPNGSNDWNYFRVDVPNTFFIQEDETVLKVSLLMSDITAEDVRVVIYGSDEEGTHDFIAVSAMSPTTSNVSIKFFVGVRLLKGKYVVHRTKVEVQRAVVHLTVPRVEKPIIIWPYYPTIIDNDY